MDQLFRKDGKIISRTDLKINFSLDEKNKYEYVPIIQAFQDHGKQASIILLKILIILFIIQYHHLIKS